MRRGGPDLKDDPGRREVLERQVCERSPEHPELFVDAAGIVRLCVNPDVEVSGRAGLGMDRDRVGIDDREARISGAECAQQIEKIRVHRDPTP